MGQKRLVMIHGRDFKPSRTDLKQLWTRALRHGVKRDYPDLLAGFDDVELDFIYYGHLSGDCLRSHKRKYNAEKDLANRRQTLKELKGWQREDFLGDKGAKNYRRLLGRSSAKARLADLVATPLRIFHLDEILISKVAPDMRYYWNMDSEYASNLRWKLTAPMAEALTNQDDVMLISHSLGSVIAFDVLWKFSYYGEYRELRERGTRVNHWLTMGSPLGNETVKQRLKGAAATGPRRYPTIARKWTNIAAKDDFICHDERIGDDYRKMAGSHLEEPVVDIDAFNLAVRGSKSNPHHGAGYLVMPQVADAVAAWLSS